MAISFRRPEVKLAMQVFVSLFALIAGVIVLSGDHDATIKHAASGWIGAVVGYWLS